MEFEDRWKEMLELSLTLMGHDFPPGWIISQEKEEARIVYDRIAQLSPKVFVEIGSQCGGSLFLFSGACDPDASIFSIDAGEKYHILVRAIQNIEAEGRKTYFILAYSTEQKALDGLKKHLGERKIDVLHIDGGHREDVVQSDWDTFSELVAKGGLVLFHDIAEQEYGVKDVWGRIKASQKYHCEDVSFGKKMGMGLLEMR